MRFVVKIGMPTAAENAAVGDPDFEATLTALFVSVGAQAAYSRIQDGRRFEYILIDIPDVAQITAVAKPIFEFLNVKPEFLPEVAPEPLYGF